MKVLIVGASGMIGGEALVHCLAHPNISKVVAFVRRELPTNISDHSKLECVLVKDFTAWTEILQAHADAAAMIWAMGSYAGSLTADLEYPVAFMESMVRVLETEAKRHRFRYVHLSGKFVRRDQEEKLWWGQKPRKIKGLCETRALEIAQSHTTIWETFIVRPGGVVMRDIMTGGVLGVMTWIGSVLGENWSVRVEEVGAYMTYLAVNGEGEESLIENARIVIKGREILQSQSDRS